MPTATRKPSGPVQPVFADDGRLQRGDRLQKAERAVPCAAMGQPSPFPHQNQPRYVAWPMVPTSSQFALPLMQPQPMSMPAPSAETFTAAHGKRQASADNDEGTATTNMALPQRKKYRPAAPRPTLSWTYQQRYDYIFSCGAEGSGVALPRATLLNWDPVYIQAVVDAGHGQQIRIKKDCYISVKSKSDEIRESGNCVLEEKLKQLIEKAKNAIREKEKQRESDLLQQNISYIYDLEAQLRAKSSDTTEKPAQLIVAPPGNLGATVCFTGGKAIIGTIARHSFLWGKARAGDCIATIDGAAVSKLDDLKVGSDRQREVGIVRCLGRAGSEQSATNDATQQTIATLTGIIKRQDAEIERLRQVAQVTKDEIMEQIEKERKAKEAATAEVAVFRAEAETRESAIARKLDERMEQIEEERKAKEAAIAEVAMLRAESEKRGAIIARMGAEKMQTDAEIERLKQVIDSGPVAAIEPASAGKDSKPDAATTEGQKANRSSGTLTASKGTKCTKLKALLPAQTSSLPFPIGCKVWYKFDGGMASGNVTSISLDIVQRKLYYEIKNTLADEDGTDVIPEDDLLSFGAGCPVRVQTGLTDQYLFGVVLHGSKVNDTMLYTLLLFLEGKQKKAFVVEEDVVQERVIYHAEELSDGR